jgi:TRAP transporter TAXI family solute receptor
MMSPCSWRGTRRILGSNTAIGVGGWLLIAVALLSGCRPEGSAASRRFLSIGTAGTGGIYYPVGGALASRLSIAHDGHQYTAEVTGGSVENVNRVANSEMDLGFTIATTVFQAYNGGIDYPDPITELRLVAPLYPNVAHILVAGRSPIASPADLRGKRVSVGSPGSGTEQSTRQLLEIYGITYEDIEARYLSFRESSDALRDGAIDAAIFSVGYPASSVLEAITSANVRLLPVDSTHREALVDRYPYYAAGTIPAGAYPGVEADIPTVAVLNWIVATEHLDAEVVRRLLEMLLTQRAELEQVHRIAAQIDLGVLDATPPIPLHDETARWWTEMRTRER